MKIELLYFDACPTWQGTLDEVRRLVTEAQLDAVAELHLIAVTSDDEAQEQRFLGSPTVRVDGVDVDASAKDTTTFGLQCRVYSDEGRLRPSPPASWIRKALGHQGASWGR
jgi:hypothetical protein